MTMATDKRALARKLQKDCQVCFKSNKNIGLVKINGRMVYACPVCVKKCQEGRLDIHVK